jgi:hypothetical protein
VPAILSNELFWYIIESEVALLAVCLPALSGIRRTRPVDSIIRSIQSKFTLRSAGSTGDIDEKKGENEEGPGSSPSNSDKGSPAKRDFEHLGVLPDLESQTPKGS